MTHPQRSAARAKQAQSAARVAAAAHSALHPEGQIATVSRLRASKVAAQVHGVQFQRG